MKYDVSIFGIELTLDPVAFTLPIGNGWDVYWYGIIIAIGFICAIIYGYLRAPKLGIDVDRLLDVVLVATPVAILCARAYYVIFDGQKLESFGEFFGLGGSGISGLAIYGGVIGAVLGGVVMALIRKVKIFDLLDLAAVGFLIGQGIGRWGNFMNQEAYGDFTGSTWWGMTSNKIVSEYGEGLVHPCFLYESIWCLTGALVLHLISKKRSFSGQVALSYCVWYGFGRAIIELLRTDSLMIGPFKVSFLLSALACIVAAVMLIIIIGKKKDTAENQTYKAMFVDELAFEVAAAQEALEEEEAPEEQAADEAEEKTEE